MLITRTNPLNGYVNTINIPISQEELNRFNDNPHKCIQDIFPNLSADHREFMQSGIWEFDKFIKDPDDIEDIDDEDSIH